VPPLPTPESGRRSRRGVEGDMEGLSSPSCSAVEGDVELADGGGGGGVSGGVHRSTGGTGGRRR